MDSYQAVYDAVCSRLRNTDVGEAIRSACHVDASHAIVMLQQEFSIAAYEMQRPSVLYRPDVFPDGPKWCALYGKDLQMGVAGFGDSPAEAMTAFDAAWIARTTSNPSSEPK